MKNKDLFWGALVADAAAMGLHWIYDFDHLQKVAEDGVTFRTPDSKNYEGVFAFFAHETRSAGHLSHYGEAAVHALSIFKKGQFSLREFQSSFQKHFGPGGQFVGYIDNPTRVTLENLSQDEELALEKAKEKVVGMDPDVVKVVWQKVLPYTRFLSGESLVEPIRRAIEITYKEVEILDFALEIARTVDQTKRKETGADDEQCPALQCLPAFLAYAPEVMDADYRTSFQEAVRVTNNRDQAVAWASFAFDFLHSFSESKDVKSAWKSAYDKIHNTEVKLHLDECSQKNFANLKEAAQGLGQTCYMKEAIPLCFWIFHHSSHFQEAIELNIRAGGDSCGRSLFLGPFAALREGHCPEGLTKQVHWPQAFEALLMRLKS